MKFINTMEQNKDQGSLDPEEVLQFDQEAEAWWDPNGIFKPLHEMNPCRLHIIKNYLCDYFNRAYAEKKPLAGLKILDIGCGGGLLTEPLARLGATVTGLDAGIRSIETARCHAQAMEIDIAYHAMTAEAFVDMGHQFDCVISLEVLEHLASIPPFLKACQKLLNPQGTLILSTLNRTPKSFLGAIVAGEYILKWLPRGTHDWKKFIKPSELAGYLSAQGLAVKSFTGMAYDIFSSTWRHTQRLDINYFCMAENPSSIQV